VFKIQQDKTTRKFITRITIDLDSRNIKDLINCLKTLKKYHFNKELTVRLSPSGHGFHVIAWSDKGVPLKKLLKIRRKAGDDNIRTMLDAKSNRMINVLFTSKKKNKTNLVIDNIPLENEVEGSEENVKISFGEI
jgi:hypothetical protein